MQRQGGRVHHVVNRRAPPSFSHRLHSQLSQQILVGASPCPLPQAVFTSLPPTTLAPFFFQIYTAVLVSGVQQSESVKCIYMSTLV